MHYIQFTVEGRGTFPVDMLRYDSCFPSDSNSASLIINTPIAAPYQVSLTRYGTSKADTLVTEARWQSFGWRVVERGIPRKIGG